MRRFWVAAIAGFLLVSAGMGCGGSPGSSGRATESAEEASGEAPSSSSSEASPPLVGEWTTTFRCADLVRIFRRKGFQEFTLSSVAGHDLIPGVEPDHPEQIPDKAHPCKRAVPREHSHFFHDGAFGSRDYRGNQVDDGSYEILDDHMFVLGGGDITFRYRVRGDTLTFAPAIPDQCSTRKCRETYAYALSVAFPGHEWKRVG